MPFNWTTRTYTPVGDAVTAAPGQLITSANWNTIHADFSAALTTLAKSVTLNILDFGGDSTGTSDNTSPFNNAVAALGTSGGAIYFPAGTYLFNSGITVSFPAANAVYGFKIVGDGIDASTLKFHGGAGFTASYNTTNATGNQSVHFVDCTLVTDGANQGTGVTLTQNGGNNGPFTAINDFTRVAFRGSDGYGATNYWSTCVSINGVSNIVFNGCTFCGPSTGAAGIGGTGVNFTGLSNSQIATALSLYGCSFNLLNIGFNYGANCQSVNVDGCFFNSGTGINANSGLSATNQLFVRGCFFSQGTADGNAIVLQSAINYTLISNSAFVLTGSSTGGVDFVQASGFAIVGCQFQTSITTGVIGVNVTANSSSVAGLITDNVFGGFSGSSVPVAVQSGANNIIVRGNAFVGDANPPVANAGTGSITDWWWNNNHGGFAALIINGHGSSGDHGLAIAAGSTSTSDSSTTMISFATGNDLSQVGSVSRSGTGVAYNTTSDAALKENIVPSVRGVETVKRIPVHEYNHIGEDRRVQGFIAQHVQPHYPEAVNDQGKVMMLEYGRFAPLHHRAIQEIAERLEALEQRMR